MIKALLDSVTCGDLIANRDNLLKTGHSGPSNPICLDSSLTVQEGCAALASHKISSAPVYDAKEKGFIGMLDFRDFVVYLLEVFHKITKVSHTFDSEMEVTDIVKRALTNRNDVPVKYISNISNKNPLIAVASTASVSEAVEMIVRHKIHRLVVIESAPDTSNKFVGIISQSIISAYVVSKIGRLSENQDFVWSDGMKSVSDLGMVQGNMFSIDGESSVLDALRVMYDHSISSVPIIERSDGKSKLLGSIGMTDIKDILSYKGGWRKLYENAYKFFAELRYKQGLETGSDKVPSFMIHPTTSLLSTIEKMAATRAHRMWIVEGADELIGVVSLTDVLPYLLK